MVLSRLLKKDYEDSGEEREAELHLYSVSHTSRLYLHLQSSWNSFIIVSEESIHCNSALCKDDNQQCVTCCFWTSCHKMLMFGNSSQRKD